MILKQKGIVIKIKWLIFLVFTVQWSYAQKVTVSGEISVRNNFAYDILPNVGDHIIFYHDRGTEQIFEVYDKNLSFIRASMPEFEVKNIKPLATVAMDSTFHFYYSFRSGNEIVTRAIAFDKYAQMKDSVTLSVKDKKMLNTSARFAVSSDKSKVLLFTPMDKMLYLQMIDNRSMTVIYDYTLSVPDLNLKEDFEKLIITNDGEIFIIAHKSSLWSRSSSKGFKLIHVLSKGNFIAKNFVPESDQISEVVMAFDEKNKRIALGGFITNGDESLAIGYFAFSLPPSQIPDEAEIIINKFSKEFMSEATGKAAKKVKYLSDYHIKDIIVRQDGGVLLLAEMVKEFVRRNQMIGPGQFDSGYPYRGYVDYYHEDVILLNNYADGSECWKKVLFKKQFSQDDSGVFSSYFLFKTPSRLRFIYNDEIKNENTVSEYVIDPSGNYERKSVLSTEYQNLRLRFHDAVQTSSTAFIVPSEKSSKINLVKIEYQF